MTVTYKRKYSLAMLSPLLLGFDLMLQDKAAWSPIVLGYEPPSPGLFGDWGGMRTTSQIADQLRTYLSNRVPIM